MNSLRGVGRAWTGRATLAAMAAFSVLLSVACAPSGGSSGSSAGGTITVAQQVDAETLDPAMHRSRETQNVTRQIMDGLIEQGPDLKLIPKLATSWENQRPDYWVVKLRQGVTFTNGEPFNADAVVFTFKRIHDPAQKSPRTSLMPTYAGVEAIDQYTVGFRTKEPDAGFAAQLAFQEIVPPGYLKQVGDEEFAKKPIGTGPFILKEWVKGQRVVLTANANYWGGKPKVDQVIFRPIPELASRVAALKAGEVQIITTLPPDIARTFTGDIKTVGAKGTRISFLGMNVTQTPFSKPEVRQAMNKAVNQETLARTVFDGRAEALNQPAFKAMDCYDSSYQGYPKEPAGAAAVLGTLEPVMLDVATENRTFAEAVAGQLRAAGLRVTVNSMEAGAFTSKINKGQSPFFLHDWGFARGDCNTVYTTHFWSGTRKSQVFTGFSSPPTDAMMQQARTAMSSDLEGAKGIYRSLMRNVMDNAPWVPLVTPEELYGVSSRVKGWEPFPSGRVDLVQASLSGN